MLHAAGLLRAVGGFAALLSLGSCAGVSYVAQAASGQLDLWRRAEDIEVVLADPTTAPTTRALLAEIAGIKAFAASRGLKLSGNYEQYVAEDPEAPSDYVVWFVNASEPLSFEPKLFSFPIVGSFPGLSWFRQADAEEFADELRVDNWDVNVRGVRAYSTGGWFDDPVLWTMFTDHENAYGYLTNVILHESVHASVLVKGQQYFNESLASFVADQLAPAYLAARFGERSEQLQNYRLVEQRSKRHRALLTSSYTLLSALYQSSAPEAEKFRLKAELYRGLQRALESESTPNNATLVGLQLYQVATAEFLQLLRSCGADWSRFMRAVSSLRGEHFQEPQQPDFGPLIVTLANAGCASMPSVRAAVPRFVSRPAAQRLKRARRWPLLPGKVKDAPSPPR